MTLSMKATAGKVVFSYDAGSMTASWTLRAKDGEAELLETLRSMLDFLRGERPQASPVSGLVLPNVASAPAGRASAPAPLFTGKPAITPPSLEASIASLGNGWELIQEGDDD